MRGSQFGSEGGDARRFRGWLIYEPFCLGESKACSAELSPGKGPEGFICVAIV